MLGIMTILLGVIYPLVITGVAQLAFPNKANGSLVEVNGALRGSKFIGQKTDTTVYFHSRPSATDYNTLASGASNLGLTNKKLYDLAQVRKLKITEENNLPQDAVIPSEMLFASASGLDPHISPEAAKMQINRIAKARGFSDAQKKQLSALVDKMTEAPQFGIFGCTRVNVLMLNLELDKMK
jgi:K+-transporting ATPase ATPase C chain